MRKKEHIHLHALLAEVTRYLIEDDSVPVEVLSVYEVLGTRPASIHEPKGNHREAILVLSSALERCLEQPNEDSRERSVNR